MNQVNISALCFQNAQSNQHHAYSAEVATSLRRASARSAVRVAYSYQCRILSKDYVLFADELSSRRRHVAARSGAAHGRYRRTPAFH